MLTDVNILTEGGGNTHTFYLNLQILTKLCFPSHRGLNFIRTLFSQCNCCFLWKVCSCLEHTGKFGFQLGNKSPLRPLALFLNHSVAWCSFPSGCNRNIKRHKPLKMHSSFLDLNVTIILQHYKEMFEKSLKGNLKTEAKSRRLSKPVLTQTHL